MPTIQRLNCLAKQDLATMSLLARHSEFDSFLAKDLVFESTMDSALPPYLHSHPHDDCTRRFPHICSRPNRHSSCLSSYVSSHEPNIRPCRLESPPLCTPGPACISCRRLHRRSKRFHGVFCCE